MPPLLLTHYLCLPARWGGSLVGITVLSFDISLSPITEVFTSRSYLMRGKQVPAHRTEIQFNQLMESELSTPHPLPATKSIFLQQHIHYSRVCTKCFNGFAIRATIIVHQQVLGIMFGRIYSCKPIKQRATKKEIWESVWKRVKKTGEGRLLWLKVFVIYTFFLEFSTFPLCMSNMVLYITHCTVAFTYQEFCSWIRINTSDGFFFSLWQI